MDICFALKMPLTNKGLFSYYYSKNSEYICISTFYARDGYVPS